MKSFLVAGTRSGVGKTTIATGLMAALSRAGYQVQPFKVGPDYIDPGFHDLVTGRKSSNLDSYFLSEESLKEIFYERQKEVDLSIIEGVMGLFDGKGDRATGSTAEIAKILGIPVILVMDARKLAQSGGALAYGYANFDPEVEVRGMILNRVSSQHHYELIKNTIVNRAGLPVVGYLPADEELTLPERHLGLVPVAEKRRVTEFYDRLTERIKDYIELEKLMELAEVKEKQPPSAYPLREFRAGKEYDFRLAVAYDEAFNFYYQENLNLLTGLGVKLEYFSPLKDEKLPPADGVYIGGGFPESFLEQLVANSSLKEELRRKIAEGLPVYAECGGLMYLTEEIVDTEGKSHPMVGAVPARVIQEENLQALGYVEVEALYDTLLLKTGQIVRGHEFHYSRLEGLPEANEPCYRIRQAKKNQQKKLGYSRNNLLASYVHLHFGSNPQILVNLLEHQGDNCVT